MSNQPRSVPIGMTSNIEELDYIPLILAFISVAIIIFFAFKVCNNISKLLFSYYDKIFKKYHVDTKDDDNKYIKDDIEFKNKSNEILNNINSIKLQHKKEFTDLKHYKTKYNLDNINYSEVDNKILSKKYDDYEYNNQPNFINFIVDIFKPTQK